MQMGSSFFATIGFIGVMSNYVNITDEEELVFPIVLDAAVAASMQSAKGQFLSGGANIYYKVDKYAGAYTAGVSGRAGHKKKIRDATIAAMAPDVRATLLPYLPSTMSYDTRGLACAVGYLMGRCVTKQDMPTERCAVKFLSNTISMVGEDSLVVAPHGAATHWQVAAYAVAAKLAGCTRMYISISQAHDLVPTARAWDDWRRALFAISRVLLSDAAGQNMLGHVAFALSRGLSMSLHVNSHSDEGGWARDAMEGATYCVPRGYVDSYGSSVVGFSEGRPTEADGLNSSLSLLLEVAGLLAEADPLACEGGATLLERESAATGRPSEWQELWYVLSNWQDACCSKLPMTRGSASDTATGLNHNTFDQYFENDSQDRHLARKVMIPYLWVEPCGVCPRVGGTSLPGPGGLNCPREMDFLQVQQTVTRPGHTIVEDARGVTVGPALYVKVANWQPRTSGLTYIAGSNFSARNGMAAVEVMEDMPGCEQHLSLSRTGVTLAEQMWKRPHCSVPALGECCVGSDGIILKMNRASGTNLLGPSSYNCKVTVSVSSLALAKGKPKFSVARGERVTQTYKRRLGIIYGDYTELDKDLVAGLFVGSIPASVSPTVSALAVNNTAGPPPESGPDGNDCQPNIERVPELHTADEQPDDPVFRGAPPGPEAADANG